MIPKIIHYCWFGEAEKPALIKRCIASWRRFAPDYEIREWTLGESGGLEVSRFGSLDANSNPPNIQTSKHPNLQTSKLPDFVRDAVAARKWAFASDWARIWIVYHEGGLYFDTDLELIRPIDDIADEPFFACERDNPVRIGTGLGFACEKGAPVLKEILDKYETLTFDPACHQAQASPAVQTEIILKYPLIRILPECVFNPKGGCAGEVRIRPETRGIHHFTATWFNWKQKLAYLWYPRVKKWFRR